MTVLEALKWAEIVLKNSGVPEPMTDAEWLLSHILQIQRTMLKLKTENQLDESTWKRFEITVQDRAKRIPLAYVLGKHPFCDLELKVNDQVMIPRPETEQLVEVTANYLQRHGKNRLFLADIGTGCGAIALALANRFLNATVYGIDISSEALKVAEENAQQLNLSKRVVFLKGWMTKPLEEIFPTHTFDAIVANLPYISDDDWDKLQPEVRCYEPKEALRGGEDGLDLIRAFLQRPLKKLLTFNGFIGLEIGAGTSKTVQTLLKQMGFNHVNVHKDMAGIERIIIGWG